MIALKRTLFGKFFGIKLANDLLSIQVLQFIRNSRYCCHYVYDFEDLVSKLRFISLRERNGNFLFFNGGSLLVFLDSLYNIVMWSLFCTFSGGKPVDRLTRVLSSRKVAKTYSIFIFRPYLYCRKIILSLKRPKSDFFYAVCQLILSDSDCSV